LKALVAKGKGCVAYQLVQRASDPNPNEVELAGLKELIKVGVEVLAPIRLPQANISRASWQKVLNSKHADFYPDSVNSAIVYEAVNQFSPNMVLVPWSEWLTGLCAELPIRKFAYYGNPDHKSRCYRLMFDRRHGIRSSSRIRSAMMLRLLEKRHLEAIFKYDIVANVAQNDAKYYSNKGHPHALYLQNVWINRIGDGWISKREHAEKDDAPIQILANIGQLSGTANRYGLELLGRELAPRLKEKMKGIPYALNVYGAGVLPTSLSRLLERPEIKMRGFVDDIDSEILASQVFVCLNNASPFKVGHTRYLHGWSLGACVIAHQDAALSMPEMRNGYNCLLGRNLDEMSDLICLAMSEKGLRRKIGFAGYETFKKHFSADVVASKIWKEIGYLEFHYDRD
jgi:glycosyltransferase involved in cell wall biosynthesis